MDKAVEVSRRMFVKNATGAAVALSIPAIIPANAFGANDNISYRQACADF